MTYHTNCIATCSNIFPLKHLHGVQVPLAGGLESNTLFTGDRLFESVTVTKKVDV